MLLYDVAAVAILAFAGFGLGLHGVALSSGGSPRGNDRLLCRVPAAQALKCDDGEELVKHLGLLFVGYRPHIGKTMAKRLGPLKWLVQLANPMVNSEGSRRSLKQPLFLPAPPVIQEFRRRSAGLLCVRRSLLRGKDLRKEQPILRVPFIAAVLCVLLVPVFADAGELFRYKLPTKDGRKFEYVFESSAQSSPRSITREEARMNQIRAEDLSGTPRIFATSPRIVL